MLPLSFSDFLYFYDFEVYETKSAFGGTRKQAVDKNGEKYDLKEVFACNYSIPSDVFNLIDKMKEGVALCPHGRPIIVKITRKELEKMFKRVL